jgi:hypothetical protein
MNSTRRVFFNPTSVPGLRTKRIQTRDFYNAGALKRVGLRKNVWSARWRGVRKERIRRDILLRKPMKGFSFLIVRSHSVLQVQHILMLTRFVPAETSLAITSTDSWWEEHIGDVVAV